MHLNFLNRVVKILSVIAFIFVSNQSMAITVQPYNTTCYGVGKNDNISFKSSCRVAGSGGTGIYSEVYSIKGRIYNVTQGDYGDSMNDRPVQIYGRNGAFVRLPISDTGKNYVYHCYKSSQGHFCTK